MYKVKVSQNDADAEGSRSLSQSKEHVIVVMNSVFPAEAAQFVAQRYDLKGSTVGRECSEEEKEKKGSLAVLKDLDLAREVALVRSLENPRSRLSSEYGLHIGPTAKAALLSQLRRDVALLTECQVMDYSLLVGVVDMDSEKLDMKSIDALIKSEIQEQVLWEKSKAAKKPSWRRSVVATVTTPFRILVAPVVFLGRRGLSSVESTLSSVLTLPLPYYGAGLCGVDGGVLSVLEGKRNGHRAIFYLGLIDFLQPWTTRKVLERQMKGLIGYDIKAVSCVNPEEYASRFLDFIETHVS